MTLYEKLIKLREAVPYAQQDAQGYQYDYVSGTSLLAILRPKMDELGVLLIPSIAGKSLVETQDDKGKKLYLVALDMTMTWMDSTDPGDSLPVSFAAFGAQNDPSKAFGSALTYSERYFLLKFFNIPTDKLDPDSFQEKNRPKSKPATQAQEKNMFKVALASGWSKDAVGRYLIDAKGIKKFKDLSKDEAEALTDYFKQTPYEKSDRMNLNPGQDRKPTTDDEENNKNAFHAEWINLRDPGYSTYIHTPGNRGAIKAALERWPDLWGEMVAKWEKLYPETPWPLDSRPETKEQIALPGEAGDVSDMTMTDNPEDWFPNDELQVLFDKSGIDLKDGGDKIRQYMAREGLTGDEVEAKLVRLGIYKSAEAWKVFSEKALF